MLAGFIASFTPAIAVLMIFGESTSPPIVVSTASSICSIRITRLFAQTVIPRFGYAAIAGRELRLEQRLTRYISKPVRSRGTVIRSRNSDIGQSSVLSCLQVRAPASERVNERGLQFLSAGASHRAFVAPVLVVQVPMDLRRGGRAG